MTSLKYHSLINKHGILLGYNTPASGCFFFHHWLFFHYKTPPLVFESSLYGGQSVTSVLVSQLSAHNNFSSPTRKMAGVSAIFTTPDPRAAHSLSEARDFPSWRSRLDWFCWGNSGSFITPSSPHRRVKAKADKPVRDMNEIWSSQNGGWHKRLPFAAAANFFLL